MASLSASKRSASATLADFMGGWASAPAGKVAIDPVLGRIVFADDLPAPGPVTLDYNYGFPAELGGGPYDRTNDVTALNQSGVTWTQMVGAGAVGHLTACPSRWRPRSPRSMRSRPARSG